VNEGSALSAGELIARLDLDDPSKVKRAEKFTGDLPALSPPTVYCDRVDHRFTQALNAAKMIMAGKKVNSLLACCSLPL
jgi:acetyl-CoA carboxylase/biotin carboxylase 1